MNRQAYIAVSYQHKKEMAPALAAVKQALYKRNLLPVVFAESYAGDVRDEKQLMRDAFHSILTACVVIAETSHKAIGVGIEIGYAVACKIPVIYLRHSSAEHSTTAAGASDVVIVYKDAVDLAAKLDQALASLL